MRDGIETERTLARCARQSCREVAGGRVALSKRARSVCHLFHSLVPRSRLSFATRPPSPDPPRHCERTGLALLDPSRAGATGEPVVAVPYQRIRATRAPAVIRPLTAHEEGRARASLVVITNDFSPSSTLGRCPGIRPLLMSLVHGGC